jgi:hypothetical protein
LEEAGAKPFELLTPAESRVAAMELKDLGAELEAVASMEHRFIPGPTADLPIWIYRPGQGSEELSPGLIYFHGSGWVIGNIETCDAFTRALANRSGCTVIAVNYQKAPEHKFPTPMDDCYAATLWVFENAAELAIRGQVQLRENKWKEGAPIGNQFLSIEPGPFSILYRNFQTALAQGPGGLVHLRDLDPRLSFCR